MVGLKRFEPRMYLLKTVEEAKTKITQRTEKEINLCITWVTKSWISQLVNAHNDDKWHNFLSIWNDVDE